MLNDAIVAGGFLVSDGQVLKLKSKEPGKSSKSKKSSKSNKSSKEKDPREGHYKYEFDLGLTLEEVDGISVRLVVSAVDASENASDPVEVAPPAQRLSRLALTKPVLPEAETEQHTFGVDQNFPNPFNPSTTIRYTLSEASSVRLVIYNILGQQVRILVNTSQAAGAHSVMWDGRDALRRQVSTGLYLYRLEAGTNVVVRKMVFAK